MEKKLIEELASLSRDERYALMSFATSNNINTLVRPIIKSVDEEERQNFADKTIILFATSGSSGMGSTDKDLKSSVDASTTIMKGKVLNGNPSVAELQLWAAF